MMGDRVYTFLDEEALSVCIPAGCEKRFSDTCVDIMKSPLQDNGKMGGPKRRWVSD